jgi:hypothetical protein
MTSKPGVFCRGGKLRICIAVAREVCPILQCFRIRSELIGLPKPESYPANIGNPGIRDLVRSVGGSGAGAGPVANGGDIFGAGDA